MSKLKEANLDESPAVSRFLVTHFGRSCSVFRYVNGMVRQRTL
jgi:hypothetical protein